MLLETTVGTRQARAEINPLVPPAPCCTGQWRSYPSAAVECIPLPDVPLGNPELATDPTTATPWQLTVHEAIRIALANSEVVRNLGLVEAHSEVDIVRGLITQYDPLAAQALADAEWGIFDPLWTTSMQWDRIDIPPGTSFSGIGNRPPELDTADFFSSLEQLLPGGSRLRADWVTDYLFNPAHPVNLDPNPQYFSYAQFGLIQPILQGRGVPVTMAPIRIAAAEAERTDWQFKQEMLALVRSIETAYWTLYSEQRNLRALDEALPLFREIVRVRKEQASRAAGTETEVARAASEELLFEQRRFDTLSRIAEQQLVLRNLMGLPPNDGRYLALVALPVTSPPFQTVGEAISTAINQRPDVLRQRLSVYVAQQEQVISRDALRPRLDFNAFWRINGLGEDLPDSLDVVGENDFHDWNLGVTLQVPLGRRQARANLRAAEFIIQKERALLDQAAHQAAFEVADAYRRIIWLNQQHRVSSERVTALTQWRQGAQAQFENPPPGISTVLALELYLDNLRDFVEASIKANAILADYNSALARLEEVKGTLLETRLVEVMGDATPEVPEELPTPQISVPEWMQPTPAEVQPAAPAPNSDNSMQMPTLTTPPVVSSGPVWTAPAMESIPATQGTVLPPASPSQPSAALPDGGGSFGQSGQTVLPESGTAQPTAEVSQPGFVTDNWDGTPVIAAPSQWRQLPVISEFQLQNPAENGFTSELRVDSSPVPTTVEPGDRHAARPAIPSPPANPESSRPDVASPPTSVRLDELYGALPSEPELLELKPSKQPSHPPAPLVNPEESYVATPGLELKANSVNDEIVALPSPVDAPQATSQSGVANRSTAAPLRDPEADRIASVTPKSMTAPVVRTPALLRPAEPYLANEIPMKPLKPGIQQPFGIEAADISDPTLERHSGRPSTSPIAQPESQRSRPERRPSRSYPQLPSSPLIDPEMQHAYPATSLSTSADRPLDLKVPFSMVPEPAPAKTSAPFPAAVVNPHVVRPIPTAQPTPSRLAHPDWFRPVGQSVPIPPKSVRTNHPRLVNPAEYRP
jgi:outer membrane protein TolC